MGEDNMFNWKQKYESIYMSDFATKVSPQMTVIDVRTPMEFQMGHISESKNHPLD